MCCVVSWDVQTRAANMLTLASLSRLNANTSESGLHQFLLDLCEGTNRTFWSCQVCNQSTREFPACHAYHHATRIQKIRVSLIRPHKRKFMNICFGYERKLLIISFGHDKWVVSESKWLVIFNFAGNCQVFDLHTWRDEIDKWVVSERRF